MTPRPALQKVKSTSMWLIIGSALLVLASASLL
jgi:hypothetical protein